MPRSVKLKENDWVCRVGYPVLTPGFTQTFEHIEPNAMYRVDKIDKEKEAITLEIIVDMKLKYETFWMGNFEKVTCHPILFGN